MPDLRELLAGSIVIFDNDDNKWMYIFHKDDNIASQ